MTLGERLRPLKRAVLNFHEDDCLNHAAAVAFYSLLSLGPLLYLVGRSLGPWFEDSSITTAILEVVASFFPPAAHDGLVQVDWERPESGTLLWWFIIIPAFLWVAGSAFMEFEFTLNVAFGRSKAGGALVPRLKAFALLGAGWLMLGAGLVFSTLLPRLGRFREALGLPPTPDQVTETLSTLAVAAGSFGLFTLFYRVLSRGNVAWTAAARGALLALVLWESARLTFGTFLGASQVFGLWKGALAGMVAFLLWIYVSVAIVLMGAELAAVLNGNRE